MARQAERYIKVRVMLAGDAAHILPAGAAGVNVALADAFDLGWKLAATALGHATGGLLETYHAERHPVGALVQRTTRAQALLGRHGPPLAPVRGLLADLPALAPVNTYLTPDSVSSEHFRAGERRR
ncbi:FAD-dependent monooxygenase [Streptomyces sp. NPDC018045]|uniref:FAD-dependent monooxygenase n=1 Tax=Streptomyces sp. NPDC018045 TaxID=3365037 RepID=UPI0037AF3B0C